MSNSVVTLSSFNLLFFTQVLTVLTSTIKYNEYVTDKGGNISIPCIADGNIMWVKEYGSNNSTIIQTGKYLVLTNVTASDRGLYVCFAAVTPSRSIHNVNSNTSVDNSTSLNETDIQMQNEEEENNEQNNNNNRQQQENATRIAKQPTTVEENFESIIKTTQKASTTSMLPMPNVTATATTTFTPNSTSLAFASASATATTNTLTTTIVIKTLSDSDFSTHSNDAAANSYHSSINTSEPILTTFTPISATTIDDIEEQEFQAFHKINLTVRTPPGPVTKLYFQASTILGFLIWRFNKTNSGGYPVRSFTAEFRNISYKTPPLNSSDEHEWSRMDPINIAPNVRQMEVYRLEPNTTYEFRIWANNQLGSGDVVTTNVTTLPETKEEDLIRLIQPDLDNFDPRIWIVAVSIVLGTFVILAIGLCIVLTKECYQSSRTGTELNSISMQNNSNNTYFKRSSETCNNVDDHHHIVVDVVNDA